MPTRLTLRFLGLVLWAVRPSIAADVTLNSGGTTNLNAAARDTAISFTTQSGNRNPGAFPYADTQVITQGASSSSNIYNFTDENFNITLNHTRAGPSNSASVTQGDIYFGVSTDTRYALTGDYSTTDSNPQRTILFATLTDVDTGAVLFHSRQLSDSTTNASFTLGGLRGDNQNEISGSPTGPLLAGHRYALDYQAQMYANVGAANIATASGKINLAVAPPTTYAILVGSSAPADSIKNPSGREIRGDRDAARVQAKLTSNPGWKTHVQSHAFDWNDPNTVGSYIDGAIANVATKAREGDTLFFYYAGHGSGSSVTGVDEELNAVSSGGYTDNMLTAALHDSRLAKVRKIIILDSCHSGGFLTGDYPGGFAPDLESLENFAILAAASEDGTTGNDPNPPTGAEGTGYFTNHGILPHLSADATFNDLRALAAVDYTDTLTSLFRDSGSGTSDLKLFAYASPDFDTVLPLNGIPVPDPSTHLLWVCACLVLGTRRRYRRAIRNEAP